MMVLVWCCLGCVFFFKQKTAYEMRISDWSSDVCSSDLWACIYAIVPRLSLREPKQIMVGMHFWLAFIGLMAYMISLMAGGTLKGLSWINGDPFIESVTLMMPFWVWRAIGGTMMFISHLVFAWNIYTMLSTPAKEKITEHELS